MCNLKCNATILALRIAYYSFTGHFNLSCHRLGWWAGWCRDTEIRCMDHKSVLQALSEQTFRPSTYPFFLFATRKEPKIPLINDHTMIILCRSLFYVVNKKRTYCTSHTDSGLKKEITTFPCLYLLCKVVYLSLVWAWFFMNLRLF